jgi:hypothetical protein
MMIDDDDVNDDYLVISKYCCCYFCFRERRKKENELYKLMFCELNAKPYPVKRTVLLSKRYWNDRIFLFLGKNSSFCRKIVVIDHDTELSF